ncbi:MmcQ/YjbR family DNA-binding protein [Leucobacter sp. L43]|uniref:MmcQ/YjbR family DNA-binding protein n=1 Tax=Leucobacter sp. L43 TaxID=2798040 RepID=UPI001902D063|nr:MmcQ/YjbR family DNA-binding protein [Leucobacter sp. L43]
MDGLVLQERAAARTNELPGAALEHPFGPEFDVYKVCGRVFMLVSDLRETPIVTLKAAPADATALREAYAEINPGYHMNKKHWITLTGGGALEPEMLDDLVTESYLLVVEKLPQRLRPVDPATFGRRVESIAGDSAEPAPDPDESRGRP